MSKTKEMTCPCGWVAFAVTRTFAKRSVASFNAYFATLSEHDQRQFYGGDNAKIEDYERCMLCGGSYKNFKPAAPGDCPNGCTLSPIIVEKTCPTSDPATA